VQSIKISGNCVLPPSVCLPTLPPMVEPGPLLGAPQPIYPDKSCHLLLGPLILLHSDMPHQILGFRVYNNPIFPDTVFHILLCWKPPLPTMVEPGPFRGALRPIYPYNVCHLLLCPRCFPHSDNPYPMLEVRVYIQSIYPDMVCPLLLCCLPPLPQWWNRAHDWGANNQFIRTRLANSTPVPRGHAPARSRRGPGAGGGGPCVALPLIRHEQRDGRAEEAPETPKKWKNPSPQGLFMFPHAHARSGSTSGRSGQKTWCYHHLQCAVTLYVTTDLSAGPPDGPCPPPPPPPPRAVALGGKGDITYPYGMFCPPYPPLPQRLRGN